MWKIAISISFGVLFRISVCEAGWLGCATHSFIIKIVVSLKRFLPIKLFERWVVSPLDSCHVAQIHK